MNDSTRAISPDDDPRNQSFRVALTSGERIGFFKSFQSAQWVENGDTALLNWNLCGRDCVVIYLRKGVLRIGSDDAENLAAFLRQRIGS